MKLLRVQDLGLVIPSAAATGASLAALQPGAFWTGWAGFTSLLVLGLLALVAAVRWAGAGRRIAVATAVALGLRLLAGTALYVILPVDGYDEPDDRAGHVFTDAHRRDVQAWELAWSAAPLWSAFDSQYYTDQYGGLLALSAMTYRLFSPDTHRPLLILTLAALAAALGVPFFFKAAATLWDPQLGNAATWFYALYPESVLTGGAQMREPFLLTLIAIALWGFAHWLGTKPRAAWIWLGIGFGGIVLISPGIALALLIVFAVWLQIRGHAIKTSLSIWVGGTALFLAALLFLAWSLGSRGQGGGMPVSIIINWFREAVAWVIFQLERGSGQVQNVFSKLFPAAQFAFVVAYGVTQPLLPAAILEPTTLTWHVIGILRSTGWYLLLPLLTYAPFVIRRFPAGVGRRVWAWLAAFSWLWILICSVRAGGDQWDNPRYRLIFLGFHALVATWVWRWWRAERDPWLPRIIAAELACLLLFGQWYLARYYLIGIHFPIMVVMAMCATSVVLIMVGGTVWDRLRAGRRTS